MDKKKAQAKSSKVIFILDQKRISDIGIQMSGYPLSADETIDGLLDLDDALLDQERLQKLLNIAPSSDEANQLKSYEGNPEDLCSIEILLTNLLRVPRLPERLECMIFKNKFDTEFANLSKNIATITLAIKGIKDNDKFKTFLAVLLRVGNYLNAGTNKGKQQGFAIDLLLQLGSIKSVGKKKISLMEFVVRNIIEYDANIMKFTQEMLVCNEASKIDLNIITSKVAEFKTGLVKINKEIEYAKK